MLSSCLISPCEGWLVFVYLLGIFSWGWGEGGRGSPEFQIEPRNFYGAHESFLYDPTERTRASETPSLCNQIEGLDTALACLQSVHWEHGQTAVPAAPWRCVSRCHEHLSDEGDSVELPSMYQA